MEKKNFVQDAMQEVESLLKNAFAAAMQQGKLPENELPAFTVEIRPKPPTAILPAMRRWSAQEPSAWRR